MRNGEVQECSTDDKITVGILNEQVDGWVCDDANVEATGGESVIRRRTK